MSAEPIQFTAPTATAYRRMKMILFQPFDMKKWFALGFTAWLAGLLEGGGSSGGNSFDPGDTGDAESAEEFFEGIESFVRENLEWILIIGGILLVFVAVVVVALLWVSSRGKFQFLDNVVHNRDLVSAPWREFRSLGNSLFKWRLAFLVVNLLFFALIAGGGVYLFLDFRKSGFHGGFMGGAIVLGLLVIVGILFLGYISVQLENFVIPIMYRDRVLAGEGWRRFLALHGSRPGAFILFYLWMFLIGIGIALALLAFMIMTCCLGLIILVIPYIGAVAMLPISVFTRSIGLEFLRQFGNEYDVWEAPPLLAES